MGLQGQVPQNLLESFDEKVIRERFDYLKKKAEVFIETASYGETAFCNDRILMHVIVDYFEDIRRLKDFHGIEFVKTTKIAAYTIAWWLRRKPIQFRTDKEEKDIFINERFALSLMMNECFFREKVPLLSNEDMETFQRYLEYLFYYFKYRNCDPQVVELLIESFKMGSFVWERQLTP